MKIIFTGDNHVWYHDQHKGVTNMMKLICSEKPDVVCNIGDFGEILMSKKITLVEELFSCQPTLYVFGNHDIYNEQYLTPPEAMDRALTKMKCGKPLQTSWKDTKTSVEMGEFLFLGTMGFPDFKHPKLMMPLPYYDDKCPTIDGTYMNLQNGWIQYTRTMVAAFEKKLALVDNSKCSTVIILTHYPIFETQYRISFVDEVSAYFYCHSIGLLVKEAAERNPGKAFYCMAGHGHEYCQGEWVEDGNVFSHGFVTRYNEQKYVTLVIP